MNRRNFLKKTSIAIVSNHLVFSKFLKSNPNINSIVYELDGISIAGIKTLFTALGGLQKFIPGDISKAAVLIKPNLCLPHPTDAGTISSAQSMELIVKYLIENGVKKIIIADHTLQKSSNFRNIELHKVIKKYPEVTLLLADEERLYQPVQINGKVLKSTETLKILQRVDFLINLATAKHHSATQVSLAVKNLMGLIWNRTVFHTEMDLHQAIADLALAIKPGLNIIDARRVLLSGGPTGPGPIIDENKLYASIDILALDSIVTSRYNFGNRSISAKEVQHLSAAYENGIGEIEIENIKLEKIII